MASAFASKICLQPCSITFQMLVSSFIKYKNPYLMWLLGEVNKNVKYSAQL